MEIENIIIQINVLKNELDLLRPISQEQEQNVMQKFRLDWNYNSSNIEGNSLTYGETKALILFGHTAQAKPLKDHLEISGHDEAIKSIEDVIKRKRALNESFIRELHKIILKKPYQVDAITPEGLPTKKWIRVGEYKSTPNHVLTKTGEIFHFASPEETPVKMHELLTWFSKESGKNEVHPVIMATEFHYRFIRIHPFDDGNGRIARLLMNFVLMQNGYPPAIIKAEKKQEYLQALEQADAGNLEFFFAYVGSELIYSLDLMLRAARGENIEELADLDKKLKLLKEKVGNGANSIVKLKRSPETIKNVFSNSVVTFLMETEKKLPAFDSFFKSRNIKINFLNVSHTGNNFHSGYLTLYNNHLVKALEKSSLLNKIDFSSSFNGLVNSNRNLSLKGIYFSISFFENVYELSGSGISIPIDKLYDQFLEQEEIESIINQMLNWQYELLENLINDSEK